MRVERQPRWLTLNDHCQGYHDIATVLLLTFVPDLSTEHDTSPDLVQLLERLSLHRLRDSMGAGLGPLMGQLR